jgi:hypothetical protein
MVISFDVAKAQYNKKPTNDVYKPYSGGSLAKTAYAIPWGMTTKPTVTPISVNSGARIALVRTCLQ